MPKCELRGTGERCSHDCIGDFGTNANTKSTTSAQAIQPNKNLPHVLQESLPLVNALLDFPSYRNARTDIPQAYAARFQSLVMSFPAGWVTRSDDDKILHTGHGVVSSVVILVSAKGCSAHGSRRPGKCLNQCIEGFSTANLVQSLCGCLPLARLLGPPAPVRLSHSHREGMHEGTVGSDLHNLWGIEVTCNSQD